MSDAPLIIVRSAGERTAEACAALARAEAGADNVVVINERPFEAALRRCYEIALDHGRAWTMTLDADVLLRRGAVGEFSAAAAEQDVSVFQIQGAVYDKFYQCYRKAGHRLYRTKTLDSALRHIPEPGAALRPETYVTNRMEECGCHVNVVNVIVGIHDFEQFYIDIYRKATVFGRKHLERLGESLKTWRLRAEIDDDFRVALRGLIDGLLSYEPLYLDVNRPFKTSNEVLTMCGLEEKDALGDNVANFTFVESLLKEVGPLEWSYNRGEGRVNDRIPPIDRLWSQFRRLGWLRIGPWIIGACLARSGAWLQRMSIERLDDK